MKASCMFWLPLCLSSFVPLVRGLQTGAGAQGEDVVLEGEALAQSESQGEDVPWNRTPDSGRRSGEKLCDRSLAPRRQRPVLWIHIHKSAGSTMCDLAKDNDECTALWPMSNCNCAPSDVGYVPTEHATCKERATAFRMHGATWGAIEREIEEDDICLEDFNYAIMLRDPSELALSAAAYHRWSLDEMRRSLYCVRIGDCAEGAIGVGAKWIDLRLWWYFDNFLVRTLGGREALETPPGNLTERHYKKAFNVLRRMTAVLLLEDLKQDMTVLTSAFGWSNVVSSAPQRNVKNRSKRRHGLEAQELIRVRQQNQLDYMLYDYFKAIPAKLRMRRLA